MRRLLFRLLVLFPCLLGFWRVAPEARAEGVTVFAAASLTDALNEAAELWHARGGARLTLSYAASSALARQIEQGAPAALFASADLAWMDWAQQRDLIVPETRRNLLGNDLVLVGPKSSARPVAIGREFDLLTLLGPTGRLAVGDPASVPAGKYAKQALTRLGVWDGVASRLAPAENVRAALLLVSRGEAPLGIVYATDVAAAPTLAVLGTFPADSHDPIVYPFAIVRAGDTPAARDVLAFLSGPEARAVFMRRGFHTE